MKQRGILIAIEGCDRGGKTTQSKLLCEYLQGEYIKFPDRSTQIGKVINEYLTNESMVLNDQTIHLLFSANRWELKDKIESLIASGKSVILDRYVPSGVAYSAAKGLDLDWCMAPDLDLPKPDIVLFMNAKDVKDREGYGDERYEKEDFQLKVKEMFAKLEDSSWRFIDATGSIEDVFEKIKTVMTHFYTSKVSSEPLQFY